MDGDDLKPGIVKPNPIRRWQVFGLICLTLLLVPHWSLPLLDPEETRYAEIPREMLHQNEWLVPLYDGQPYLDKPPLIYWLTMLSYYLGGINVASARLPVNLIALSMVALVYFWSRQEKGQTTGLIAAGMLILMPNFVHYGAMLTMNGLLGLCVLAAILSGHRALAGEYRSKNSGARSQNNSSPSGSLLLAPDFFFGGWWCISALATGLGLLAKGPVALALVAVPLFIFPWFSSDLIKPKVKAVFSYLLIAAIVAAPWYALVCWKMPEFGSYFFLRHHIERFMMPFDHAEPFWYYIPLVVAGSLPWICVALPWGFSRLRSSLGILPRHSSNVAGSRIYILSLSRNGFFLLSALWMLIFFSASGSKRLMYLVPIYPVLAIGLAGCFVDLIAIKKKICGLNALTWKAVAGLMAIGLLIWTWMLLPGYHQRFAVDEVVLEAGRIVNLKDATRQEHRPPFCIFCYPHPCSGVSFLLDRDDIRSFGTDQLEQLYLALEKESQSVVFLKPTITAEFCEHLPKGLEYSILSHNARVSAILVRHKGTFIDSYE